MKKLSQGINLEKIIWYQTKMSLLDSALCLQQRIIPFNHNFLYG